MSKPKFCSSCGEAFSALNAAPNKRIFKTNPKNPVATIQEEVEEEKFEMPDLVGLDVDIQGSKTFKVELLKDIAGTNLEGRGDGYVREADTSYSAESLAEDFLKDAGSSSRSHEQTQET